MKEVVRLSRIPPFSVQTTRHAIGRNGSWLCLHKAMHRFFRLCDDCHDDELREERRERVTLVPPPAYNIPSGFCERVSHESDFRKTGAPA